MGRALGLLVFLAATWLLLSGIYDHSLLFWLGAASCLLCVLIAWRMDVVDHEGTPLELGWRIIAYWPWLFIEIVKANIDVIRRLLRANPDISPTLVRSQTMQRTDLGRVIYANSITLTPGTISIEASEKGSCIWVHAIERAGAEGFADDEMNRKVAWFEKGPA